ncbi:MAG TPA: FAD-dependent oxidoreductase [Thermoanaerobaculia bacterium]|jgi:NADH dehydrogenase FAD-containing subunit
MDDKILILGGGYGGALAALRLARRGIAVTLVDARAALVERIRLHQVVAGDDVAPIAYSRLFRGLPIHFVQARVTAIDRERKIVQTTDGELAYDQLVYALGSESVTPEHAVSVANPIAARGKVREAKHVAVVGGGLTGIEIASEIAERHPHVDVTLVHSGKLGDDLGARAQRHLREWMEKHNVTLLEETKVTSVSEEGVMLDTGEHLYAGAVLWCGAFRLSDIARAAGLRVNERGQIIVDEQLRSSDPSILAIGDAAARGHLRMSCATALPMGAYVADLLAGATKEPFRFAFAGRCISLGRHDGIYQMVSADDTPRELAVTGRAGAWVKEMVCRYTALSLKLESRGVHYRWPKAEVV